MDTSEQYIKMCEKAGEIQGLWNPQNGDFCWHPNEGEEAFGCWEFPAELSIVTISEENPQDWWLNWLWLPRQDQLQEMMSVDPKGLVSRLMNITAALDEDFVSMEQVWLALVMKERYNKVWSEGEWIPA